MFDNSIVIELVPITKLKTKMCDRHGKKLEYFCLHHETHCCRKCRDEGHESLPCECLHENDVYDRLHHQMSEHVQDVIRLRERGQKILDGSYQTSVSYRVDDEEKHLDKFYKDMKKKFKETRMKIDAFTSEGLSAESVTQLNKFLGHSIPAKFGKKDSPTEMMEQIKKINKLIKSANSLLYSLPNYVEITVDPKFIKLLTYGANPIILKGRPKYFHSVSSDSEWGNEHQDDSGRNGKKNGTNEGGSENQHVNESENGSSIQDNKTGDNFKDEQLDENGLENGDGNDEEAMQRRRKTFKTNKAATKTENSDTQEKEMVSFDDKSDDNDEAQRGVLKWHGNAPSNQINGKPEPQTHAEGKLPPRTNKYAKQIAAVKTTFKLPPISKTPEPGRSFKQQGFASRPARSVESNVSLSSHEDPKSKLFLKNTRFKVKKRFKLDGCEAALVLKDCILLSLGEKVQKHNRATLQMTTEMKLSQCSNMCVISGMPTQVAVLQLRKCITIIDTQYGLVVIYKIKIRENYIDLCHIGNAKDGPHHPAFQFACLYANRRKGPRNSIDIVTAKETRKPGLPPMFDPNVAEVEMQSEHPKLIHGIGGFPDGHIILGVGDAVICITEKGRVVWRTTVPYDITGILCTRNLIYACVQDMKRVVIFNKGGFVTEENVVPDLDFIPCRISANWDVMLIKDFKTKAWVSVVFKNGLFIV